MTDALEQRTDDELRAMIDAPQEARAELARRRAAAQEQVQADAQADAKKWLDGHAGAVASLAKQLDAIMVRLQENANAKDAALANDTWERIRGRVELAAVVVRRFPGIRVPKLPTVLPPGMRGVAAPGLSVVLARQYLFPMVLAADSSALRDALYARAAYEWLLDRRGVLPPELQGAVAVVAPEPDTTERVRRDRAEAEAREALMQRIVRSV